VHGFFHRYNNEKLLEKKFKSLNIMRPSLNIKKGPFALLLFTAIILSFALALRPISNVDFKNKVMFGVPLDNVVWFLPLFLISFWLLYLTTKKYLYSIAATWIHVMTTVVLTLLIVSVLYIGVNPTQHVSDKHELVGNTIQVLTLLFVVGQFIFVANFVIGIIKRFKN
jgi:hypothetical protein